MATISFDVRIPKSHPDHTQDDVRRKLSELVVTALNTLPKAPDSPPASLDKVVTVYGDEATEMRLDFVGGPTSEDARRAFEEARSQVESQGTDSE